MARPLPAIHGRNALLTVIDSFTKIAWAIPTTTSLTSGGFVQLLLQHVLPMTGVPEQIVSDRGPQFLTEMTRGMMEHMQCRHTLTSAYHPQSNGLVERLHRDLNQTMRMLCEDNKKQWTEAAAIAVLTHNTSHHVILGCSPFEVLFGMKPRDTFISWEKHLGIKDTTPAATTWMENLAMLRKQVHTKLQQQQLKLQRQLEESRSKPATYHIGDMVLVTNSTWFPCQDEKFQQRWRGPFAVKEVKTDRKSVV